MTQNDLLNLRQIQKLPLTLHLKKVILKAGSVREIIEIHDECPDETLRNRIL